MFKHFRNTLLAGAAAASLVLTGCAAGSEAPTEGESPKELIPVTFQLNWVAGGFHAGFAVAVADGIYEDAGLDVTLVEGNGSGTTAQLVASNQAQLAYADAVSVAKLIGQGASMRVISTIYQSSPAEIQALKATGIGSVKDLKGHSVGVPSGAAQTVMLPLLLEANGLTEDDLTLVNMPPASLVPSLLQSNVDAILGSSDSYRVQLKEQGADIDYYSYAENGVPTVSTSIFASDRFLVDHPDVVKSFLAASLKGWDIALDDPEHALQALKTVFPDANEKAAAGELAAAVELVCVNGAEFVGKAQPAAWVKTQDMLASVGLLDEGVDPEVYYSNAFLPADADLRSCTKE